MPENPVVERVRSLVQAFLETDLVRLRIERDGGHVELRRRASTRTAAAQSAEPAASSVSAPANLDEIKSDLVGIFRFSRPLPVAGEMLESDRELAYVEALGIRNPVRSLAPGRLVSVCCHEGQPVEYGQVLFEIERV
jgi:oxaloacetate decarboxylase alpha subunit